MTPLPGPGHLALAVETWSFRRLQCFSVFGLNKIHDDLSCIFSLSIPTIVTWVASHHISFSELLVVSFDNQKIQGRVEKIDLHGHKECSHLASILQLTLLSQAGMVHTVSKLLGA